MKKFLVCVMAALCSTFSFAQADEIKVSDVTILPGETAKMEVVLDNPSNEYTALQFKMTLPEGISIPNSEKTKEADASLNRAVAPNHDLIIRQVEDNSYLFIVFSRSNSPFIGDGIIATVTLKAADDLQKGELTAATEAVLQVTSDEETAESDGTVAAVTVRNEVRIIINSYGKSTYVGAKDLDFGKVEGLKAYIATGYNMVSPDMEGSEVWLTRVNDVPAGTPVMLIGEGSTEYTVPITTSHTYYPENYLKGNAKTAIDVDDSKGYINMQLEKGVFTYLTSSTYPAGSCYLHMPVNASYSSGIDLEFTMNESGMMGYVGQYDLDFSTVEGLNAYTVTGFDTDKTVLLSRIMASSKYTPILLIGKAGQQYKVPSVLSPMFCINMLRGDAENPTPVTKTTDNGFTNCIINNGVFEPLGADDPSFPAGSCYLPVPTSYLTSATGSASDNAQMTVRESEVLVLKLSDGSVVKTGIKSAIRSKVAIDEDCWYNLNGQRVDNPGKGIYIRQGKKVIIK